MLARGGCVWSSPFRFPTFPDPYLRLQVLKLINLAIKSGIPFDAKEEMIDTPELRALLREAASKATILLKNDAGLLPLKPEAAKSIAVIGPNAKSA